VGDGRRVKAEQTLDENVAFRWKLAVQNTSAINTPSVDA